MYTMYAVCKKVDNMGFVETPENQPPSFMCVLCDAYKKIHDMGVIAIPTTTIISICCSPLCKLPVASHILSTWPEIEVRPVSKHSSFTVYN